MLDEHGYLTLFDNGNYRAIPPAVPPPVGQWTSRAVTYRIDPVARTTQQVWQWAGGGTPFFSGFLGSATPLGASRNVLVDAGALQVPGQNKSYSRLQEVTTSGPAGRVFELVVNDPGSGSGSPYNWNVYRSRRVSGLYPHQ